MPDCITRFRRFNRFYVRLLGVMRRSYLDGPLNLAEARVLFELRDSPGLTAASAAQRLDMDKGHLSRILKRLVLLELAEREDRPRGRAGVPLAATPKGLRTLSEIESRADTQARALIKHLTRKERDELAESLERAEGLLDPAPKEEAASSLPPEIRTARSGELGWVIVSHTEFYGRAWNFGSAFERYLLQGLADYDAKLDRGRSRVFIADAGDGPAGSIGIVESGERSAQLRWFLVLSEARGGGMGNALLRHAVDFARTAGYEHVFLWTFQGLSAARRLYSRNGFVLTDTRPGSLGGVGVVEEKWELDLRNPNPPEQSVLRTGGQCDTPV